MSLPAILLAILLGLAAGGALAWIFLRGRFVVERDAGRMEAEARLNPQISAQVAQLESLQQALEASAGRISSLEAEKELLNSETGNAKADIARLSESLRNEKENARRFREDEENLANRFASLSRTALTENRTEFGTLTQPVQETLQRLTERVGQLDVDKTRLADEARNLANALKQSHSRGRWGELQLKRVAELAGMLHRCDFTLQETINTEEQRGRPDMIVHLPRERFVVVDSKAVMDAYIDACNTDDAAEVALCMGRHAKHVRAKIDELSKTDYPTVLERKGRAVADMVVCYIPGENFFSAAIAEDNLILEYAAKKKVFLASPTILITLLRAIELGWRDEELSAGAEEIKNLGKELYKRLSTMKGHFDSLGSSIENSVKHYNKMVGSLSTKVFPQARRFHELKATEHGALDLSDGKPVETQISEATSSDWEEQPLQLAASGEELD